MGIYLLEGGQLSPATTNCPELLRVEWGGGELHGLCSFAIQDEMLTSLSLEKHFLSSEAPRKPK